MKKRNILILALLLILTACGGNSAGETTEAAAAEDGFVFTYQGVEIRLNGDMAPILEQLGNPISYTEAASCAFDGLDKTYYYGSFYIDTYPSGDSDYVYSFWFCDDGASTAEGISIGAEEAQVAQAYPEAEYNGANAYTITSGSDTLRILLTDGVVSSIQYSTSVG